MKKINRNLAVILSMVMMGISLAGCGLSKSTASATTASATIAAGTTAAENEITAAAAPEAPPPDGASMKADYDTLYENIKTDANQDSSTEGPAASEEYNKIVENGFLNTTKRPLSTFSADVDTAAYSNIRRMIAQGQTVPADAVRIEEMINYFHYDYKKPENQGPFTVTTELSGCPWNQENQLLLIGIQGKEIDFNQKPVSNLVFLMDVSGSMYDEDKLPLMQKSFAMLTEELTESDRVSIVTYAGADQVILEGARGDQKVMIRDALDGLTAGGSTAGGAGINRAYELAEKYFIAGGNNRVILATDGDMNVGISSERELTNLIEKKRKSGVHLSVLGFGTGNIKDNKMEALADHGDGNYYYIDTQMEAKKVLVEEMGGTLITIAKDVKFQVEFNPKQVKEYRLIGYENRALKDEDFSNDTVDAGEIGSGHRVTALYEIIRSDAQNTTELKYQKQVQETKSAGDLAGELLTVNIRYKAPNGNTSQLISMPVQADSFREKMPDNLNFASAVAEFGMLLRDSEYKGSASYAGVLDQISAMPVEQMDDYKREFRDLVQMVMD